MRNASLALLLGAGALWAEPVTVAALGDSLTAGYGLETADGFVPQMQAWLDAQGADVRLINAGVSGDTTAGGLSRLAWTLGDDVDAVIVALGGNDYLRGLDPAVSRANLDGILNGAAQADVSAMLVGITAGSNYGPDFQTAFNGMYADLAAQYDTPLVTDWFAGIQAAVVEGAQMQDYLQADGIHPNAEGVALIVEAMGPALVRFVNDLQGA